VLKLNRLVTTALAAGLALAAGCVETGPPQYTILLSAIVDPDQHVQAADDLKDTTEQYTRWKDVFVVHEDGISQLYWGKYPSIRSAQGNLNRAQRFQTSDGYRPFAPAMIVPLPIEAGPPEYDLTRANGTYTLVVAQFYDVPEAKYIGRAKFALDYCKQLRDEGHEAYYHHQGINSYVTIGAFPAEAYRMMRTPTGQATKRLYYSPELKALMKEFPILIVNGRAQYERSTGTKVAKGGRMAVTSYVMDIPIGLDE